ncbi:DUF2586 domain-containing protein [Salmonella enterica]|uniref:DUF2586 domain-containing protein n=1 Tax=Salmonella enterica TaxID=28901 RepID=UPI0021B1EFC9|nr:DUF2586 domain-containing protein [Salmonella enterica]MCT6990559.1 DUF2586 domain-containing protein [Salmonella enterica subsp. enterica serovar Give]
MTFPQVVINQLNTRQGGKRDIARTLLMVGEHTTIIPPTPVTRQFLGVSNEEFAQILARQLQGLTLAGRQNHRTLRGNNP